MFFHKIELPKRFSALLSTLFAIILLATPVLLFLLPQSDFSEDENRMLATPPPFSAESLFEGTYTTRLSDFLRDRLPARSALLKVKSLAEYALLKQENNHVIIAKDSYLIKRFDYGSAQLASLQDNVTHISSLRDTLSALGKPAVFVCAPRAVDVLADHYAPKLAEPQERSPWQTVSEADGNAVTLQNLLSAKVAKGERIWFRTDHHWTALGAYYAYEALGTALGYTPLPRGAFREIEVSDSFLGSSYSACLFPLVRSDRITAMRYVGDTEFVCTDMQTGRSHQGFYFEEKLSEKDQYQYFLGANTAHIRIVQDTERPRPTLLIIKDSYAQCLGPFLARHFDIELLDLRYFRTDATETVRNIVNGQHYAGTLILCNADTLTASAGFERIDIDNL